MQTIHPKLSKITQLTHDVFHYDFEWDEKGEVEFKAGQFFMMKVDDGRDRAVNRSYSLASEPNPDGFALCIKLIPDGRGSELLRSSNEGDIFEFMGACGHFFLQNNSKEIVMVATGTGLAPFMGMLPVLFEQGAKEKITLLFGVRTEEDLFYMDQLNAWDKEHDNFEFRPTLSRPSDSWTGETGRVTAHFEAMDLDPENTQIYACGNGQMIIDIKNKATERGFPKGSILFEQFSCG